MALSYEQLLFNVLAIGDWYLGNPLAQGLCGTFTARRREEDIANLPEIKVLPANTKHRWNHQAKDLQLIALQIHASNKSDAEKKAELLHAMGDTTDKIRLSRWGQSLAIPFKGGSRFADMLENLIHRTNETHDDNIMARESRFPFKIPLDIKSIDFSVKSHYEPKEPVILKQTLNIYIACHIIFTFKKLFSLDAKKFAPLFSNPAPKTRMRDLAITAEHYLNPLIKFEEQVHIGQNPVKIVVSGELSELILQVNESLEDESDETTNTNSNQITNNKDSIIKKVVGIVLNKLSEAQDKLDRSWKNNWDFMPSIKNIKAFKEAMNQDDSSKPNHITTLES